MATWRLTTKPGESSYTNSDKNSADWDKTESPSEKITYLVNEALDFLLTEDDRYIVTDDSRFWFTKGYKQDSWSEVPKPSESVWT